jgi:hypothetical protein
MNCSSEEIYRASLLVGYALSPKNRPSAIVEYAELIRAYRTVPGMREAASRIAAGLKIELIDEGAEVHGLIVRVNPGSLFTPTLQDFRGTRSVEERIGYGLLFFVIAAYVYPTREALAEDAGSLGPRVRVAELVEFARRTCETLRGTVPSEDTSHAHLVLGFDHLLSLRETGKSEREQKNLTYMARALVQDFYAAGVFLREGDPLKPGDYIYFARPHYRIQVRTMVREASAFMQSSFDRAQEIRRAG